MNVDGTKRILIPVDFLKHPTILISLFLAEIRNSKYIKQLFVQDQDSSIEHAKKIGGGYFVT
jgi:hypothetical protein